MSRPLKETTVMNVDLINLSSNVSSRLFREKLLALFSFVLTKEKVWQGFPISMKVALKMHMTAGSLLCHRIDCNKAIS
jgi:hypothetical protein